MHRARIIPVLLLHQGGLVKTTKFKNPGYVGDPLNAVRIFNEKEVDELIVLDIAASKRSRSPDMELIASIAEECFMPVCYGGGVSSIDQMHEIFALGIEKIALNSVLFDDVSLIQDAAAKFGSQSIVASIDCKKGIFGSYSVHSHSDRKVLEKDPALFARKLQDLGAGEILVTAVNNDGVREGFDSGLYQLIAEAGITVPIIACGGGGTLSHFVQVLSETPVAAAAGGSFFVYQGKHKAVLISYPASEQIEKMSGLKSDGR